MSARAARWPFSPGRAIAVWMALVLCTSAAARTDQPAPSLAAASAPVLSSAPDPQQRLQGATLLRALRQGGLVIYFRHTATDFSKNDQGMRGFDDCANQRPLSEPGRRDAEAIGRRIAELQLPIGAVKASPMCRTMETARLMFGMATATQTMRELTAGEYLGLRRLLSERVAPGTNLWLVGHGIPFRAVAGPPQLAEGEAVVLRPSGDTWTVLARVTMADWAALKGG